ncbi:hypothetical protein NQZ68_000708 [Dissostichus eleginoides]|nr:hypothetical protein NQZ68_000708 [Dissostichus eleginoides]
MVALNLGPLFGYTTHLAPLKRPDSSHTTGELQVRAEGWRPSSGDLRVAGWLRTMRASGTASSANGSLWSRADGYWPSSRVHLHTIRGLGARTEGWRRSGGDPRVAGWLQTRRAS